MAMRIQKSKYQKRYEFPDYYLKKYGMYSFPQQFLLIVNLNTETCKFLHIKTEILTANFLPILFALNHWEFATNQSLLVYKGSA